MSNVNVIEKTIAGVPTDYYYEDTAGRDMIAAEQDLSLVAIKDYAVGELFWYNNLLYRAKTTIEENATIVLATDAEQTTVSAELATKQNTLTFDNTPTDNSNNPVTSGGTKSAIDASQNTSLQMFSNTVGWIEKNLAPIKINYVKSYNTQSGTSWSGNTLTRNGMSFVFTVDDNGYVTSIAYSGTPTSDDFQVRLFDELPMGIGSYILTGASTSTARLRLSNGRTGSDVVIGHQGENPAPFTLENSDNLLRLALRIQATSEISGTIQPMIRLASVTDDTFEPYHEDVDTCKYNRSEANILGAKNLLPNKAVTTTYRGITYTVNSDKTVSLDNGTATGGASVLEIAPTGTFAGYTGKYILSGCPSGGSSAYSLDLRKDNGSVTYNGNNVRDYGNGIEFDFSQLVDGSSNPVNPADVRCIIRIAENTSGGNGVFKPMLRLASDPDNTYVPYAKTNKELTDEITTELTTVRTNATLHSEATDIGVTFDSAASAKYVFKYGKVVNFRLRFVVASAVTLSGGKKVASIGYLPVCSGQRCIITDIIAPYSIVGSAVNAEGDILFPKDLTLQAGTYDVSCTFICQ